MTAHVCSPHAITVDMLKSGSRSSVRELCTHCQKTQTWLMATSGAIVALNLEARRKR